LLNLQALVGLDDIGRLQFIDFQEELCYLIFLLTDSDVVFSSSGAVILSNHRILLNNLLVTDIAVVKL